MKEIWAMCIVLLFRILLYSGQGLGQTNSVIHQSDIPGFPVFLTSGGPISEKGSFLFSVSPYLVVLDQDGDPRFFRKINSGSRNFSAQPGGLLTYHDLGAKKFIGLNKSYDPVDTFGFSASYLTDFHTFSLLPDGHYVVMAYHAVKVDMSQRVAGGDPDATVTEVVIQELDSLEHPLFTWHSLDHIPVTDADSLLVDLTATVIDYMHTNSITLTPDGHFLLTSRNLSEVTKIDRQTGDILWRLGGKRNQFGGDSVTFRALHAASMTDSTHLILFDNGYPQRPFSMAEIYLIDQSAKKVSRIKSYPHSPEVKTPIMGNVRVMNEQYVITGWGKNNRNLIATVFDTSGTSIMDIQADPGSPGWSYQASWISWQDSMLALSADSILFDAVGLGDTALQTLSIRNTSDRSMDFTGFRTVDNTVSCTPQSLSNILPGDSIVLEIRYIPRQSGLLSDKLFFYFKPAGKVLGEESFIRKVFLTGEALSTGILKTDESSGISLYPNPASGYLMVRIPDGKINLSITDPTGKICYQNHNLQGLTRIELGGWFSGIYLVHWQYADGRHGTQKLVISHE